MWNTPSRTDPDASDENYVSPDKFVVQSSVKIPCPYCDKGILHNVRLPHEGYNVDYSDKECPICRGSGEIPDNMAVSVCPECGGNRYYQPNPGEMFPDLFNCETCIGTGVVRAKVENPARDLGLSILNTLMIGLTAIALIWAIGKFFGWW